MPATTNTEKKKGAEKVNNRIRENSPEAVMIGALIFGEHPHLCRIHQSAYERMPLFACRAAKVDFDGDLPSIRRRMLDAGLGGDEVELLLETAQRSFEAVRRRSPHTFPEGSGRSIPKPSIEIFNQAQEGLMQQPKRKEINHDE